MYCFLMGVPRLDQDIHIGKSFTSAIFYFAYGPGLGHDHVENEVLWGRAGSMGNKKQNVFKWKNYFNTGRLMLPVLTWVI